MYDLGEQLTKATLSKPSKTLAKELEAELAAADAAVGDPSYNDTGADDEGEPEPVTDTTLLYQVGNLTYFSTWMWMK